MDAISIIAPIKISDWIFWRVGGGDWIGLTADFGSVGSEKVNDWKSYD